ncbi:MAG: glycosyltransferase [Xanthobacteraceae bacterium]
MDVILLSRNECGDALYGVDGRQRLDALFEWLEENGVGEDCNLYATIPLEGSARTACFEYLRYRTSDSVPKVHLVVPSAQLSEELLGQIETAGLYRLLISAAGQPIEPWMDIMARYLMETPRSRLECGFWLTPEHEPINYARMHALLQLGIPGNVIDSPLFPTEEVFSRNCEKSLPFKTERLLCQIFTNALTIDSAGDVRFCPRQGDCGTAKLGNIFCTTPAEILRLKGHRARQAGAMPMCSDCEVRGRFSWPNRVSPSIGQLYREGQSWSGAWPPVSISEVPQFDFNALDSTRQELELVEFGKRVRKWSERLEGEHTGKTVSIEVPVFKGGWLMPCIESVLCQTSPQWELSLLWDGGDDASKRILERVAAMGHPKVNVYFQENHGIARARRFLSDQGKGDFILPLDDDDMLASDTVEKFLSFAEARPWNGLVRAQRSFINEVGEPIEIEPWFPFEPRHYFSGMVTDLLNHSQPYMIRRAAYDRTAGWEGFEDFHFAGEDCDIFTKIEEVGSIELLDELLYYYRLHDKRASHSLRPEGAYEMWRRLADKTIARIGLPLRRVNEFQPFRYQKTASSPPHRDEIDFVIPFYESDEEELSFAHSRPPSAFRPVMFELDGWRSLHVPLEAEHSAALRIHVTCSSEGPVCGLLRAELHEAAASHAYASGVRRVDDEKLYLQDLAIELEPTIDRPVKDPVLTLSFVPDRRNYGKLSVLQLPDATGCNQPHVMLRLFRKKPGYAAAHLSRCLQSLRNCGIREDAIHVVERRQSSSANRNEGFRRCVRPFICFLDDDVEIREADTFDRLLETLDTQPADLIGPKIVTPLDTIFSANPYFNEWQRPVPRGLGEVDRGQYDYLAEVPWLPSTVLLVRREVIKAVGGFDEGYVGSQMEDVDLCFKARQRDFRCIYSGEVSVVHYNYQRNHSFSKNFERFHSRWKQYPSLFEVAAGGGPNTL